MQMRAAPAKFLFENDFTPGGEAKPLMALDEHAARLKEAEAAAFARGFEQGANETRADAEKQSAATFERIAAAISVLDKQIEAVEAKFETEAVEVAVAVARSSRRSSCRKSRSQRSRGWPSAASAIWSSVRIWWCA
jgi:flagellar assembly protein FliH